MRSVLLFVLALGPLQAGPIAPPGALAAAFSALERGDGVRAEALFREIVTAFPWETEAYRGLARAYAAQGRVADGATMLVQVGARMQQAGRADAALPLLDLAIELAPGMPAARYYLGAALAEQGDHASAAAQFRRALDLGDAQLATRVGLAAALWESGDIAGAEREYRAALEVGGHDPVVLHQFATLLLFLGRDAEAAELLAVAVERGAPGPYVLLDHSRALAGSGALDAAIAAARQATELAPGLAQAHYQLGTLLVRSGDREAAASALEEVRRLRAEAERIQREAFRGQAALDEARALLLAGDADGARAALAGLEASPRVLELRAAAESAAGDHAAAVVLLERLLELEPARRDVQEWLVRERSAAR